jgi:hypothetical protein
MTSKGRKSDRLLVAWRNCHALNYRLEHPSHEFDFPVAEEAAYVLLESDDEAQDCGSGDQKRREARRDKGSRGSCIVSIVKIETNQLLKFSATRAVQSFVSRAATMFSAVSASSSQRHGAEQDFFERNAANPWRQIHSLVAFVENA